MENDFERIALQSKNHEKVQTIIHYVNKENLAEEHKSKIMRFGRFAKQNSKDGKIESFDFLGFTFINGETLTEKYRVIYRTSKKKLKAKKQAVKEWLKENMHGKPSDTIEKLNRKLVGHYAYYGISGNYQGLLNFYRFTVSA